ncbi:hypothetical protein SAMN02745121_06703 [Nannocystis exedens]|uniref:Uncharacterized protein n=1 Tax=Nannocystis exedens TaxID=54 RepID=A0A1I2FLM0_9BACT|nr:hypothetical protein [Nannocystis exedens]PCC74443.1 hypothetical protein NAEX_07539 [Nannocystis exedens]SFF05923.1 hypothetical protein SAMN02745121_06703 [Nannocystis exedens]
MTTATRLFSTFLGVLPVLGLSLGGCKEDDAALDSGIDGAKQGDELTDAEKDQFCEAADAYGEQVLSDEEFAAAMCTYRAIGEALIADGSVDTCDTLRQNCLANKPETEPEGACDLGIDWANCKATIAELEACYEEFGASFAARMRSFSCAKMAEYAETPPSQDVEVGPDCSIARAECPSIMSGG